MKVKIIRSAVSLFENEINKWLTDNKVEVIDIKFNQVKDDIVLYCTALIMYK